VPCWLGRGAWRCAAVERSEVRGGGGSAAAPARHVARREHAIWSRRFRGVFFFFLFPLRERDYGRPAGGGVAPGRSAQGWLADVDGAMGRPFAIATARLVRRSMLRREVGLRLAVRYAGGTIVSAVPYGGGGMGAVPPDGSVVLGPTIFIFFSACSFMSSELLEARARYAVCSGLFSSTKTQKRKMQNFTVAKESC
jgi:hypothetical protein